MKGERENCHDPCEEVNNIAVIPPAPKFAVAVLKDAVNELKKVPGAYVPTVIEFAEAPVPEGALVMAPIVPLQTSMLGLPIPFIPDSWENREGTVPMLALLYMPEYVTALMLAE